VAAQAQSLTTADAASAAPAVRPDPLDPKAPVPVLSYASSFSRYRRLSDDKALSWRHANDTVGRIGGWRSYARESQEPAPVAPAASSATVRKPADAGRDAVEPLPMPQGHSGHKTQ
jgi:hypothetical protein